MNQQDVYRVLIPLDGSRLAEHALSFLPGLSHLGPLEITLLSVVDLPEVLTQGSLAEEAERERNLLLTYLREIAGRLEQELGLSSVSYEVQTGPAAPLILAQAEQLSPSLLVISTHGRTGLTRWRLGSIADQVVREAGCPVLIAVPTVEDEGAAAYVVRTFKQVLVPLDGSEVAEQALPVAREIVETYGARLHLLRVLPYVPLASSFVQTASRLNEELLQSGHAYLETAVEKLGELEGVSTAVHIGSPAASIEDYIAAHDIDLVVMTSHGRGGLARAMLGSVTARIVGLGPPVLVVRARDPS